MSGFCFEFRPPFGCLQYWTTLVGRFTTFNFLTSTGTNLPTQRYVCAFVFEWTMTGDGSDINFGLLKIAHSNIQ